ncbi:hypothetical protein ACFL13_01110 [Patescibacteria group bacterium]
MSPIKKISWYCRYCGFPYEEHEHRLAERCEGFGDSTPLHTTGTELCDINTAVRIIKTETKRKPAGSRKSREARIIGHVTHYTVKTIARVEYGAKGPGPLNRWVEVVDGRERVIQGDQNLERQCRKKWDPNLLIVLKPTVVIHHRTLEMAGCPKWWGYVVPVRGAFGDIPLVFLDQRGDMRVECFFFLAHGGLHVSARGAYVAIKVDDQVIYCEDSAVVKNRATIELTKDLEILITNP